MKRNPDGTRMTRKDKALLKQREAERAKFEKEYKERALINKTIRQLKNTCDRYEEQKNVFIKLAGEAKARGFLPQFNMAKAGLKIVMDSQEKAMSMYMNLTISNQLKQAVSDTKGFIVSMSEISKQLSEVNSQIDFGEAQQNYDYAMSEISAMEEKLQDFSENISSSIEEYANMNMQDSKVDQAIDSLIASSYIPESNSVVNAGGANQTVGANNLSREQILNKLNSLDSLLSDKS